MSCYETLLPRQWFQIERLLHSKDARSAILAGLDPEHWPLLFDVASVSRIVSTPVRDAPGLGPPEHPTIIHNDDALPRAYLIDRYEVLPHVEALERLRDGDFDPRTLVLLDREPARTPSGAGAGAIAATIREYRPERVVVEIDAPAVALLVLTDTDYPGWHAEVDGEPAPILRANGLYRAVAVGAGRHDVVFTYAPASLRIGAMVGLVSALVAAGAFVWVRRRWPRA